MNTEAIENLKQGMNDRVVKHFDPLRKAQMNIAFLNLVEANLTAEQLEIIKEIHAWSDNVFTTGNIACNLNIILQNQNLALLSENKTLIEENKKLSEMNRWE